ncbi:hypothetical protein M8J77_007355 [Diaphorina citri]|nr:hypothetical protein M8J77_007355 [Diaphorina citri]
MSRKEKSSKFNSQIKPGLKMLRLFALAPVSVDTYKPSLWMILLSIIPTTVCMVTAFYQAIQQSFLYDMPTTMVLLNKLHSACNAASVIFFALNAASKMKKFAKVNKLMVHVDQVLAMEKKFLKPFLPQSKHNHTKSFTKKVNLPIYLVHLCLMLGSLHMFFDYYIVLQYFNPGLDSWASEFVTLITIFIQRAFVVQLFILIQAKYKRMNKYLLWHKYSYSNEERNKLWNPALNDLEVSKNLLTKKSEGKQDRESVDQPNQKPHKSKLFVSEKSIKSFVLIHYELKHVCKIINEMFATVLCLLIFFNVVRMMLFFYVLSFVIVSMINDSPVRHKYKTFSSFIIWVFRLYYEVYVVARYCQDITNEVGSKVFTYCFILVQFQRQFEMEKFPI